MYQVKPSLVTSAVTWALRVKMGIDDLLFPIFLNQESNIR